MTLALERRASSCDSTGPNRHWSLSKLLIRYQYGLSRPFHHRLILVMKANPFGLVSAPEFSNSLVSKHFMIQNKKRENDPFNKSLSNIVYKPGTAPHPGDKAENSIINVPSACELSFVEETESKLVKGGNNNYVLKENDHSIISPGMVLKPQHQHHSRTY